MLFTVDKEKESTFRQAVTEAGLSVKGKTRRRMHTFLVKDMKSNVTVDEVGESIKDSLGIKPISVELIPYKNAEMKAKKQKIAVITASTKLY